jgi:spermidine synthase
MMRVSRPLGSALALLLALAAAIAWLVAQQREHVIFEGESEFGDVRVLEHADGLRTLHTGAGRARQSALYPGRPEHLESAYTRVAMIGLALAPADGRMLFVGLGGGAMPMYARHVRPAARIDAVEIDPLIVDVARRFFAFRTDPLMAVHIGDGRAFIESAPPRSYDVIFLDAFSDDEIPYSLTTRQFLEAVRRALTPDGVVISNLWTANPAHASMVATYHAVFDDVHFLRVAGRLQSILIAGTRPLDAGTIESAARSLADDAALGFDLPGIAQRDYEHGTAPRARVLEDASR